MDHAFEKELFEMMLRVVLSVFLCSMIGCQRTNKRHSAGLRTFMLMGLASSTAMLLDLYLMSGGLYPKTENGGMYLMSAALLVASATLSVHSLFRNARNQILGLTTAVALWTCCIIGMACGAGRFALAIFSALMLLFCLTAMNGLENFLKNRSMHVELHLELTESRYLNSFITTVRRLGMSIDDIELNRSYRESKLSVYTISLTIESEELKKNKTHREIIEALSSLEYVSHIEEM
ncbi:MAG: MgtC/SapB family protein [Lachnospiraceae bacterium]|nr:MgtC/SapB family protein [Lachnospiraceae bacterium]